MSHLDEGVIHALLDGEIPSAQLPPIQAHLGACSECRARLAGEQEVLATSDRLIELIEVPAATTPAVPMRPTPSRRRWPRNLAWAATVVLAAGLGYSARGSMLASPAREARAPETVFARSPEPSAPAESALLDGLQNAAEARRSSPPVTASTRTDERKRTAREAGAGAAPPVSQAESIPATPATPPTPQSALGAARRLGAEPMRLEETIVTSADAEVGKRTTRSPITLPDAVRKLGGSLRLIEGLIPERLESLGAVVRVVYLTGFGELVLSQELQNGRVRHTLIAPRGFPADSLERLRARVRE